MEVDQMWGVVVRAVMRVRLEYESKAGGQNKDAGTAEYAVSLYSGVRYGTA